MEIEKREYNTRIDQGRKCFVFNDALNTFYLGLYGVRHMVKNYLAREDSAYHGTGCNEKQLKCVHHGELI